MSRLHTRLALGAVLLCGSALTLHSLGRTSAAQAQPAGADASGGVAPLQAACQAQTVEAVASALPTTGVKVAAIHNGPRLPGGVRFAPAGGKLPAYCQVTGSFVTNPATGKTANFLATFPANWNGKYLQMGCSGHCGQFAVSDPTLPSVTATYPGLPSEILDKGYATFSTDEGHEGFSGATWAVKGPGKVDEDAIQDLYYRADKVLVGVGKAFTKAFYAKVRAAPQTIAHSYFDGCSGGGRDAFVAAAYFPEAFDGIIGGSAYNGIGTSFQFAGLAVASLRSPDAAITPELAKMIEPIVMAQCDAVDGVKDGLIQNPMACNFTPERDLPKCPDDQPGAQCFTKAQVQTVSAMLSAVTDEQGHVVQPGYSVSEVQGATFLTPKRPQDLKADEPFPGSDNGSLAGGYWPLADGFLKVFIHKNDPDFHTRSVISFASGGSGPIRSFHIVVPRAEVERVEAEARLGIGHFPKDADKLIRLNRKFLIWHNLSDHVLTPYMSVNYYKRLAALHGGYANLKRNVRFFGVPGTAHCGLGGVGPNTFDALGAMEDWVEKGVAPDALIATLYPNTPPYGLKNVDAPPGRSMPLCAFPEMARYKGEGDVNAAANWSCPAGDTRMLRLGESGRQAGVVAN